MPHDHDDPLDDTHHGPGDLTGWLRWVRGRVAEAKSDDPQPPWTPREPPEPATKNRRLPAAALVVLVALAGLALLLGLLDRDPEPAYSLITRRPVHVYHAPSSHAGVVTILPAGERVLATDPIGRRWGTVFEPDSDRIGFAYESAENFTPESADETTNATAVCKDGWISHSKHRSGTCSSHGGVQTWIHRPPS